MLGEHRSERGAASRKERGFLEEVALTPVPKGHWALGQQGFVGWFQHLVPWALMPRAQLTMGPQGVCPLALCPLSHHHPPEGAPFSLFPKTLELFPTLGWLILIPQVFL